MLNESAPWHATGRFVLGIERENYSSSMCDRSTGG
jgi:hypothetical protein